MISGPDPLKFASLLWPDVTFYRKQKECIYSALENDETYVPAGNMLGKDFTAGFICVYAFLTRTPCRIVTTSAKDDHLRVLWGEIMRFISTSKYPLDAKKGGPLLIHHQDIRKIVEGNKCPISYMIGLVAGKESIAAMQGHHVARTGDGVPRAFFFSDESSSVPDDYYKMASTWFHRAFIFGNTWDCQNFFRRGVKGGDIKSRDGKRYYRKVIRIQATDSPNIRLAQAEIATGKEPSGKMLIHGVKDWDTYQKEIMLWDDIQKSVSHSAQFYEGKELLLYPTAWITAAQERAANVLPLRRKKAVPADGDVIPFRAMGVDTASGGDKSCWTVVDDKGILEQVSMKTPHTTVIPSTTLALINKWNILPARVVFDMGAGGKEHADYLRDRGTPVSAVAFGETVTPRLRLGQDPLDTQIDQRERRYTYRNRRAQMYGEFSQLLDPESGGVLGVGESGFAIPAKYEELTRQMSLIPKTYDDEGRLYVLPKDKPNPGYKGPTLRALIGHSPDELDSTVLAVHGLLHEIEEYEAGGLVFKMTD